MMTDLKEKVAVDLRGLTKRYSDGTVANREIDLEIYRGEVLSILGPNGAGKTTLVRQITTELNPTSGSISVAGIDPLREPLRSKRLMGIIPQEATLFSHLNVQTHLYYFGRLKGLSREESRREVDRWISKLSLDEYRRKQIAYLSVGTRRKILVGLALMGDPPILILDEPTTGLDPATRRDVWRQIRHSKEQGKTVILTTHYLEEAEILSDRIGILLKGEIKVHGTLEEIYRLVPKSYSLVYYGGERDQDGRGKKKYVHRESDFEAVRRITEEKKLEEYSIKRISLEDIYLELTGDGLEEND
ncbi:MAG: ABC transporter ATP-binding protein [Candidatus Binatia bacterium]